MRKTAMGNIYQFGQEKNYLYLSFLFWAASALAATTAITISHIYSIGLILKI